MTPPARRANSITRYAIHEDNLVGSVKEQLRNYDLMTVILKAKTEREQGVAYRTAKC